MAETTPNYGNADSYSAEASATIKARNCLEVSGTRTVAPTAGPGGAFAGVAAYDVPKGELVTVRTTGVHTLRCTGDIAAGARVTTAPGGVVTVGEPAIGIAQSPSVGGAVRVKLIAPGGGSAGGGGGGGAAWADVHAAAEKVTPADTDDLPLMDSAATWGLKRVTWGSFKTAFANWYNAAVKVLTNTTLTTPILDRPTITGAATFRDYLPWSAQTGSTVETIGTPGKLSIISGVNSGNAAMSSTVNPLLESALADHTFRGGTVTVTINGAATTAGDFTAPIANAFAPNTAPATIVTKAATDVVVIEVDISPYRTGLFQPQVGYIARLSGSARDVTIEAFDGTSWIASTPITGSNSPVWAVRFGTVAAATKFRWTFTNLAFPTALNIIKLWAIPAWNDSIDGFGGFMTRRGGAMYGNASAPPGFTPSAGVPLRLNVSNADVELASGVPLTSLVAAPASGTAAGRRGQLALAADGNSMLVCVTTGAAGVAVWKRLTLATF